MVGAAAKVEGGIPAPEAGLKAGVTVAAKDTTRGTPSTAGSVVVFLAEADAVGAASAAAQSSGGGRADLILARQAAEAIAALGLEGALAGSFFFAG